MTDRLAAALLAEALGLPRQPPPQPPLNQQLSPAERAEVADRELRLRAELARQAEAAEEQRAEHARGMGELQREVRKLGKQADEYEVRRANLEMAAEQRVAARQRQCEAEMERQVERASAAEAHAQHVSVQLEAAHARAAAEREGHARAQVSRTREP